MLEKKDYETKEFKPKPKSEITTEPIAESVAEVKVKPKPDATKPTTNDRIAALEAVVYSAFSLKEDGTARKLKRQVKR